MLSNDTKKELREYFNIKNISAAKSKDCFWDVNLYYDSIVRTLLKMKRKY